MDGAEASAPLDAGDCLDVFRAVVVAAGEGVVVVLGGVGAVRS